MSGFLKGLTAVVVLLGVLVYGCFLCERVGAANTISIMNPYEDVNWETFSQYKGNFHTHTTESDGAYAPEEVIRMYRDEGYTILALTDHNKVTWPWEDHGYVGGEEAILGVQGSELSSHHHVVSLFNDYPGTFNLINLSLAEVRRRDGIAIIAHPGWESGNPTYTAQWYAQLLEANDNLIGQEVYNTCTIVRRHTLEYDVAMWDEVLTLLMPYRPSWGFANDDMHNSGDLFRAWNTVLLDELTEEKVKEALIKGQFFFTYSKTSGFVRAAMESAASYEPHINRITVDEEEGVITIDAEGYEEIIWYSDGGNVVHVGESLDYLNTAGIGSYVRADVAGKLAITHTQPFGVIREGEGQTGLSHLSETSSGAEFVLFEDDFEGGTLADWTVMGGVWDILSLGDNKVLRFDGSATRGEIVTGDSTWSSYVIEADIVLPEQKGTVGLLFRYTGRATHYLFCYTEGMGLRYLKRLAAGGAEIVEKPFTMKANEVYHFKAVIRGNKYMLYVNDVLELEVVDEYSPYREGWVGVYSNGVQSRTDNFKVTHMDADDSDWETKSVDLAMNADEVDPRNLVKPIDWSGFTKGVPKDESSVRMEKILLNSVKYCLTTWYEGEFGHQTGEYLTLSSLNEAGIRPPASAALAIATAVKFGIYDPLHVGISQEEAIERAVKIVKSIAYTHKANAFGGWGDLWQSAFWANLAGTAGWLLWDELSETDQELVRRMVEYEANRFIDYRVPYYMGPAGNIIYPGDTKAEENAWNSGILQLATCMMPTHENWNAWMIKNIELMISAYSRPFDLNNTEVLHGKAVKDWLNGTNAYDDGTVINHNRIHPDYMTSIGQIINAPVLYTLAGMPTPKAAFFNADIVYKSLVDLEFDSPPYMPPGGTIYIEDSPDIYYPQGNDWGTHRRMNFAMMDVYADVFGFDNLVEKKGAYWEELHAQMVLDMQTRHEDGRTYASHSEDTYAGREQWVALLAARAYQAKWIKHQEKYVVTNESYFD